MSTRVKTWMAAAAAAAIAAGAGGIGLVNAATSSGNTLTAIAPCRLVDTRPASTIGARNTPLGANETVTLKVVGDNGQCTAIPADTQVVEIQLTSVGATATSYLTAYPADIARPNVSQLNQSATLAVSSNTTSVKLSPTGEFKLYNESGTTDILIDVLAIFAPGGSGTAGAAGPTGPAGPEGPAGPAGPAGTPAPYSNPEWGTVLRNVIGPATASLRGGPFALGVPGGIPFGEGSLQLLVPDGVSKTAFGDEVSFLGDLVADVDDVGFQVYTTGENGTSMPGITFEIDPNGAGSSTTAYSSLVWIPAAGLVPNQWSPYLDATSTGKWALTGGQLDPPLSGTNCGLNTGSGCTWEELQTFLATGTGATIYSVAVTKGRDAKFQGAVDGLRVNTNVYDFEPLGVDIIAD